MLWPLIKHYGVHTDAMRTPRILTVQCAYIGLARTIYMRCIYRIFGRESPNIRSYTVYVCGSVHTVPTLCCICVRAERKELLLEGVPAYTCCRLWMLCVFHLHMNGSPCTAEWMVLWKALCVSSSHDWFLLYSWMSGSAWFMLRRCLTKKQRDRVGQNLIYSVYIRYFWQGNYQIYGHIRCIYTVSANPTKRAWEKKGGKILVEQEQVLQHVCLVFNNLLYIYISI